MLIREEIVTSPGGLGNADARDLFDFAGVRESGHIEDNHRQVGVRFGAAKLKGLGVVVAVPHLEVFPCLAAAVADMKLSVFNEPGINQTRLGRVFEVDDLETVLMFSLTRDVRIGSRKLLF